ncbi:MAG: YbjQ family protein [Elusimicrobiota bacterium]|nr:YbjQ family protein [Elusimicrobiota bacterium]
MIIATADAIEGRRIKRVIGLAKGNSVRAKFFVSDIIAGLKNIIGGEISEYTQLMAQSREQALDRMVADAEKQGANAIVAMRFTTASIMASASEILAYGTAVELE